MIAGHRLSLAVASLLGVAAASVVLAAPAQAYPFAPASQAGSSIFNFADPLVAVITQDTAGAVVVFPSDNSLDLAADETLSIVQADPAMTMQIRYLGASPIEWYGTVEADANLIVTSPAGFIIEGTVYAGGDLVLSTGEAPFDLTGPANQPVFSPLATDGPLMIADGAVVTATRQLGVLGHVVEVGGSAQAIDSGATVASTAEATWERFSEGSPITVVGGLAGGEVTVTGDVTAPFVSVRTPDPSIQFIDGAVRGSRYGAAGSASVALSVNGTMDDDIEAEAVTGGAGALAALGSHATLGNATFADYTSITLGTEGAGAVPDDSTAVIAGFDIDEDLVIDIIQARCLVEDGDQTTHLAIGGAEFEGNPVLPMGYDLDVPNQPSIPLAGGISISFNVQETIVVEGYEVLRLTAVRLTGANFLADFGVVECGVPAPAPQLAATGSGSTASVMLPAGLLVLLVGAGLLGAGLLTARRRAASAAQR